MRKILEEHDATLRPSLAHCKTISDMLNIVQDKCTILDVNYLEAVVMQLNIEEAQEYIELYKKTVDEFCQSVSVRQCLGETLSVTTSPPSLKDETITVVLDWDPDNCTLKDIINVMSRIFPEGLNKKITIKSIREGNSITVTCTFPLDQYHLFITKARETMQSLKIKEMKRLKIGHETIMDLDKVDNVVPNNYIHAILFIGD